jgi:hypothetical protein
MRQSSRQFSDRSPDWRRIAQSFEDGRFDAIAEAILAKVPRRGVPMILQQRRNGVTKPCSPDGISKVVWKIRALARLPSWFTLDGGMTELEEAELTLTGLGPMSQKGYAKRTMERTLAATRKCHAHLIASANGSKT